ncbi:hypothetical protein HDU87_000362 [Geranomyces variabilis]|uniref:Transcription factor CBF/NF-Y/archaeal histone domain-containing protein n=1 Tax=Geranomyces variabilis TaxID=109894 RepID=A0AAD5TP68_9FUNG|nr:hypothetical protein HDU87_000362 [Geranomyces variabilis]
MTTATTITPAPTSPSAASAVPPKNCVVDPAPVSQPHSPLQPPVSHAPVDNDHTVEAEITSTTTTTSNSTSKLPFPQARINAIIREDPTVGRIDKEAACAVNFATEAFVAYLAQQAYANTSRDARKIVAYKDVARAVAEHVNLMFLDDVVPQTPPPAPTPRAALEPKNKKPVTDDAPPNPDPPAAAAASSMDVH